MLKYTTYDITFSEIPGETCLTINLSNCPNKCPGCHSPELQEDIGEELTEHIVLDLLQKYPNVTCLCLMGGDNNYKEVERQLVGYKAYMAYVEPNAPYVKTAWYSGRENLPEDMLWGYIDYIKLGPYIEELGGLDNPTTNQRLYQVKIENDEPQLVDITHKFWKNELEKV